MKILAEATISGDTEKVLLIRDAVGDYWVDYCAINANVGSEMLHASFESALQSFVEFVREEDKWSLVDEVRKEWSRSG